MKRQAFLLSVLALGILLPGTSLPLQAKKDKTQPIVSALPDTARVIDIEETVVVASPKETAKLRWQPTSVQLLGKSDLENRQIHSVKDLTGHIPNFFLPDYGSRLTSAVYIRGIGSRLNTPAVGLYVDNLPVSNMSAYDLDFLDIDRIDVLRGPQATLYGRNAMGGLLRVFTADPTRHQGTKISLGGTLRSSGRRASFVTSHSLDEKWAFSLGGFYNGQNGFFRNDSTGRKTDGSNAGGGKLRFVFRPTERLRFDWNTRYEYSRQGGYAYRYEGPTEGHEDEFPEGRGRITANRESTYRRHLLSSAISTTYQGKSYVLSSVTGYQHLNDHMFLDQDFIAKDIYTLTQKQQENNWSEELTLRNRRSQRWARTTGLFFLSRSLNTQAPVAFQTDGIQMLNNTFAGYLPSVTMTNPMSGRPMTVNMSLKLTDPSLLVDGHFKTPMQNYALFHQSTFKNLLPRLDLSLGLRLDYEHHNITYRSGGGAVSAEYAMQMIPTYRFTVSPLLKGDMQHDYLQLLPKMGLTYRLKEGRGNLYAVVSKGFRSGGYNIQMYSDVYQTALQNALMRSVKGHVNDVLQEQIDNARNETLKQMFTDIRQTVNEKMPTESNPDAKAVRYKPEYVWNYEMGAHLNPVSWLQIDAALFFMDTHRQQIVHFAPSGLGRQMVNAGRSHSCGAEVSLQSSLMDDRLKLSAGYGFTHAEFRRYNDGRNDYKGRYVPFVPMHTLNFAADFCLPFNGKALRSLTFGAGATALGRTYWTESNDLYQNFYALLSAHLKADFGPVQVNLWGKNLTDTSYRTFCFESMNRRYSQKGTPIHAGMDLVFSF